MVGAPMLEIRQQAAFAAIAILALAGLLASIQGGAAETVPTIVPVKLGLSSMSKAEQANLWKMVDEYATVDALQEFCGKKLNLQRRAWRAVSACVEPSALRRVFAAFKSKKAEYLKAWETLHGEPDKKKELCDRFRLKLIEYARIMSNQIAEAASMCRNCFFC
jgi:hypothetical protein